MLESLGIGLLSFIVLSIAIIVLLITGIFATSRKLFYLMDLF